MEDILQNIIKFFQTTCITIAKTIALIILGILAIKIVMKLLRKIYLKSSMENSVGLFILSLLNVALYVGLFFAVCKLLNISTAGIIATMSTLVLAIALSLQESLKNIASGVIIVATKPFKEGDFVDVSNNIQGKILEINMFQTKLITFDNKVIIVPNSQIVNSNIINSTASSTRRIDLKFGVSYSSNVRNVKNVINSTIARHQKIFKTPVPIVRLAKHDESALIFDVKVWVLTADYYDVTYDINEMIFEAFARNDIEIPFNQMDVHIKNDKEIKKPKIKEVVMNNLVEEKETPLVKPELKNIPEKKKIVNTDSLLNNSLNDDNSKTPKVIQPTSNKMKKEEKTKTQNETSINKKVVNSTIIKEPVVNENIPSKKVKTTPKVISKAEEVKDVKKAPSVVTPKKDNKKTVVK